MPSISRQYNAPTVLVRPDHTYDRHPRGQLGIQRSRDRLELRSTCRLVFDDLPGHDVGEGRLSRSSTDSSLSQLCRGWPCPGDALEMTAGTPAYNFS